MRSIPPDVPKIAVVNKSDLPSALESCELDELGFNWCRASALSGKGLDVLDAEIQSLFHARGLSSGFDFAGTGGLDGREAGPLSCLHLTTPGPAGHPLPRKGACGLGGFAGSGGPDGRFAGSGGLEAFGGLITNSRQADAISRAADSLRLAADALAALVTPDAVLTDIEAALAAIGEVTGKTVRDDILSRVFERFCVGK